MSSNEPTGDLIDILVPKDDEKLEYVIDLVVQGQQRHELLLLLLALWPDGYYADDELPGLKQHANGVASVFHTTNVSTRFASVRILQKLLAQTLGTK